MKQLNRPAPLVAAGRMANDYEGVERMKTIADWKPESEGYVRPRVALGKGDLVDPGRYLEVVNARWEFCNILTEEAPECVDDLYQLLPIARAVIQANRSREQVADLTTHLEAWCERWHVPGSAWMLIAGVRTLTHYALVQRDTADVPLKRRLITGPVTKTETSETLEELNAGWQDDTFAVVVPAQLLHWQPTREPFGELQRRAVAFVNDALRQARDQIEPALVENGALVPNDPILKDWFVWAVHRVIRDESYRSLGKRYGKSRSTIRAGVGEVLDRIGLARPN